ncbi:hypothetical protein [Bacteroides propionicifaciens]|uniref:hypothetical protein n=1 Tax=Bacteroides propionicifaciens TaxID=392838 RepID=UPI000363D417|nr:hypothetical protein [Bacteroides propionicifaciens]
MNLPDAVKLDSWWMIILWLGVAAIASALIFNIDIINRKHLLGLGIGMFIVGITNFSAVKTVIREARQGYWSNEEPKPSRTQKTGMYIGWILIIFFGALILWSLI